MRTFLTLSWSRSSPSERRESTANTAKTNRDNVRELISSGALPGRKIGRLEERLAQLHFQLAYRLADGRLRAAELVGDPRYAALLDERYERAQERDIERSRHVLCINKTLHIAKHNKFAS